MGLTISHLYSKLFGKQQLRILMVGLDGAGKTTILYQLKFGQVVNTIPTIGFNVELVAYKNLSFAVWDVGGQEKLRRLWRHYYPNTQAVIFVVDACDRERIDDARNELHTMLADGELQRAVVLVLANKQDLPAAMTAAEIADKMQLSALQGRKWHVQAVVAVKAQGLYEGFEWLSSQLV